jgi:tRNA-dihydrouridine synthase
VTGPEISRSKPLKIGEIAAANRVLLAPMSGVTDAPFRRLAATLGAGLVVSEMTASDELVHGRPMSLLRCETAGVGAHVVQLAGCEAKRPAPTLSISIWAARRAMSPAVSQARR